MDESMKEADTSREYIGGLVEEMMGTLDSRGHHLQEIPNVLENAEIESNHLNEIGARMQRTILSEASERVSTEETTRNLREKQ